jgi:RTX calcium-binding nonapeptide repeat (4 copies)
VRGGREPGCTDTVRGGNDHDVIYGQAGNDRIVDTTAQLWPAAVEATTDLTTNARCPTGRPIRNRGLVR